MTDRLTIAEIKPLLQGRAESLARVLAPGGVVRSGVYSARNPARHDRHAGSFVVWLRGAPGAWKDYATGEQGDVIDLICHCKKLTRGEALAWAGDWLGIAGLSPQKRKEFATRAGLAAERQRAEEGDRLARNRRGALAMFLECGKIEGTAAETYLAGRGIALPDLRRQPRALRFHADLTHHPSGTSWPALVAAVTGPGGEFYAVHRTWLAPGRPGGTWTKAPVEPARMAWPAYGGGAIRLARGKHGLTPEQAAREKVTGPLVLAEGIEDGLSVAIALPDYRVWAAVSLSNLARINAPACASEIIVFADNDWGKRQAQAQLARAVDRLGHDGLCVRVARARGQAKDANDLLRGGQAA